MSEFVSVLDMTAESDPVTLRAIKDELFDLDYTLRRTMDAGLPPQEMEKATAAREAVQAANSILEKIF